LAIDACDITTPLIRFPCLAKLATAATTTTTTTAITRKYVQQQQQ
jgi:hypothetical protein